MGKKIDLTGQRFGRLTVVERSKIVYNKCRFAMWVCVCDCGNAKTVIGTNLTRGLSLSCGCRQREIASNNCSSRRVWISEKEREESPMPIKSKFFKRIPSEDSPLDVNGAVSVKCKFCGKRFIPSTRSIISRVQAFESLDKGENNFYCSEICKSNCPVFGARADRPDPRLRKPTTETKKARSCQTKTLKQIQCDETNGQSYCEKCGDFIDVELHHAIPVAQSPTDAINPASHVLLCAGCHVELHRECR